MADEEIVWAAALDAVHLMGARVRVSNRGSGIIVARLNVDALGAGVDLNVSVRTLLDGADVQVKASESGASAEAGETRREELRFLEEQYLDLVDQGVRQLATRHRGRSDRPWP
jgi:hypothetical protein